VKAHKIKKLQQNQRLNASTVAVKSFVDMGILKQISHL